MNKSLHWHLFVRIFVATLLLFMANRFIAQYLTGTHMIERIEMNIAVRDFQDGLAACIFCNTVEAGPASRMAGGIVACTSVKCAGNKIDAAIAHALARIGPCGLQVVMVTFSAAPPTGNFTGTINEKISL